MRFEGAAALKLDFDEGTPVAGGRSPLRLAVPTSGVRGPDKYRVLDHRRRQAQIKARRLLDLLEEAQ